MLTIATFSSGPAKAIEQVKESLELRAEGIAGFWNHKGPKKETECQNVLWAFIRAKLTSAGISNVEEKFIGANKCDFWVLYPRKDNTPFQIAVELKTARSGYGIPELLDPIEDQLWRKYLYPERCLYGIYIVLWFKDNQRFTGPKMWASSEKLATDIDKRRHTVADTNRVSLASYVIDMTTPYRKH